MLASLNASKLQMMSDVFVQESVEVDKCCMCMEDCLQQLSALFCGHVFHTECIKSWTEHQSFCPICKAPGAARTTIGLVFEVKLVRKDRTDVIQHLTAGGWDKSDLFQAAVS